MFLEFANKLVPFCREQLLNNIVREWCKLANVACPTKVFPVDNNNRTVNLSTIDQNDVETAINSYTSGVSQWVGNRSSFGILHRYLVNEKSHLLKNENYRGISLVLFSPKDETYQLQQMLTRIRNHWYRKLSKSPLNSGFKSILNDENNMINIVYRPKHIDTSTEIKLDDIILNSEEQQKKLNKQLDNFDIIICRTNLDNCAMAFLDDAYTLVGEDQVVLKLNTALVPFQLAITFDGATSLENDSRLNEVADYLIGTLREYSDISIFPFVRHKMITTEETDKLAIQYCAVLKEDTLKNGVIWLRNRDTRISEMIHISNFVKTMLFYLQPAKLIHLDEANQKEFHRNENES